MFNRVAIIGLGLIGGSLAHDLHRLQLARQLHGFDLNPLAGDALHGKGVLHAFSTHPHAGDAPCDLVLLAVPPGHLAEVTEQLAPLLHPGTLVMDTASVKVAAIAAIAPRLPGTSLFVPAHPIAGSERSGARSGMPGLFEHRRVILTPEESLPPAALDLAIGFWEKLGAVCEVMSAERHDLIYASMSHLPHLLAFACAETLAPVLASPLPESLTRFLRIGGSSPELWTDIALANEEHISEVLSFYLQVLLHLIAELDVGTEEAERPATTEEIATQLFPRIAISCLISTVTLMERKHGLRLARYAGTGFADFSSLLNTPPEEDIERISHAHRQVKEMLGKYERHVRQIAVALREQKKSTLLQHLADARGAWNQVFMTL